MIKYLDEEEKKKLKEIEDQDLFFYLEERYKKIMEHHPELLILLEKFITLLRESGHIDDIVLSPEDTVSFYIEKIVSPTVQDFVVALNGNLVLNTELSIIVDGEWISFLIDLLKKEIDLLEKRQESFNSFVLKNKEFFDLLDTMAEKTGLNSELDSNYILELEDEDGGVYVISSKDWKDGKYIINWQVGDKEEILFNYNIQYFRDFDWVEKVRDLIQREYNRALREFKKSVYEWLTGNQLEEK